MSTTGHTTSEPAFPLNFLPGPSTWERSGLTKRELFAAMAMQGFAAAPNMEDSAPEAVADWSVKYADALIAALSDDLGVSP